MRFRTSSRVILSNVNAILGGGNNYASARSDIYGVQDALVSILDPTLVVRRWAGEFGIIGALVAWFLGLRLWVRRRKPQGRNGEGTPAT